MFGIISSPLKDTCKKRMVKAEEPYSSSYFSIFMYQVYFENIIGLKNNKYQNKNIIYFSKLFSVNAINIKKTLN